MSLMYESGVNDAWEKLGFNLGSTIDNMNPATYRRIASPLGGAIGGAAIGAATGEEGTRGKRALMGGAIGAAGGAAANEAAEGLTKIHFSPSQMPMAEKIRDTMFDRRLPLMGAAVGAGIGAGTADEGHGLRGGVIGGIAGGTIGGIPGRAIDNIKDDVAWAARNAGKVSTASANPLGQLAHAAHLGKNGITPTSPLLQVPTRPFEGPQSAAIPLAPGAAVKTSGFQLPEGITPAMVLSPLLGGAAGAGAGALVAGEGNRGTGALVGGTLGGSLGLANAYGLAQRGKPLKGIMDAPAAVPPEEWDGAFDILNQAKPGAKQAAFNPKNMFNVGGDVPYSALKTVGSGALGALSGATIADDEHRGYGALFGGLGGAANMHLLQNSRPLRYMEDAAEVRRLLGRIGPSTLGGAVGAIAGNRYSNDDNAGAGTIMGGVYGAALGGVAGNALLDSSDLFYDIKNMRQRAKEYKNAVKNYSVRPAPPLKQLAENAGKTATGSAKTAQTVLNLGTPQNALVARYGLGALAGGAAGYYGTKPDEDYDEASNDERRKANALLGGILGAGVSGGAKHLSNWRLGKHVEAAPFLRNAVEGFKSELF